METTNGFRVPKNPQTLYSRLEINWMETQIESLQDQRRNLALYSLEKLIEWKLYQGCVLCFLASLSTR